MFSQKTIQALIILTVALLAIAGCSRGDDSNDVSASDVHMSILTEPAPPAMGPATISVSLADDDGDPVTGATLTLEGNMSHAGMQPVFEDLEEVEDGVYETSDFEFTMGGDWILTVSGELENGEEISQTVDLSGVSG